MLIDIRARETIRQVSLVLRRTTITQTLGRFPGSGRLKRLYWNLRQFRIGRRKGRTPYALLGLKVPDLSFWEILKLAPEELRETLSAREDAA